MREGMRSNPTQGKFSFKHLFNLYFFDISFQGVLQNARLLGAKALSLSTSKSRWRTMVRFVFFTSKKCLNVRQKLKC